MPILRYAKSLQSDSIVVAFSASIPRHRFLSQYFPLTPFTLATSLLHYIGENQKQHSYICLECVFQLKRCLLTHHGTTNKKNEAEKKMEKYERQ